MNVWLFAENEFNKKIDESNNFEYFVIDKKKLNRLNFSNGDYLITYVTKIMKITDIRQIVPNEPKTIPPNINYDRKFDFYLESKLIKKLEGKNWIDRKLIFPKLNIFQNKIINLVLLSAPLKLDEHDSVILLKLFDINF